MVEVRGCNRGQDRAVVRDLAQLRRMFDEGAVANTGSMRNEMAQLSTRSDSACMVDSSGHVCDVGSASARTPVWRWPPTSEQ